MTMSPDLIAKITDSAAASPIARFNWHQRGLAPIGYTKGVAVAFAKVLLDLRAGKSVARAMAALPISNSSIDALAWYDVRATDHEAVLIRLFALMLGLGMRESSGNCFEGRDMSADNVTADAAEAGLFQQSRDSFDASPLLPALQHEWLGGDHEGFLSIFRQGMGGRASEPSGKGVLGVQFQQLAKTKPQFAVECAGVTLRVLRRHWGPIRRHEAQLRPEAIALFERVREIVNEEASVA